MGKVVVDKKAFGRALAAVRKTGSTEVRISVGGGMVNALSEGLHFAARSSIIADGDGAEAATTVDLRRLSAFVGALSGDVSLSFDPFVVSSGSARLTLPSLDIDPQYPALDGKESRIDGEVFRAAVAKAIVAAGDDDTRPYTTGVRFENGRVTCTDGHRLVRVENVSVPALDGVTVPARALAEVCALSGDLRVSQDKGLAKFAGLDGEVTARLVEGDYPNVDQAIPTGKPEATLEVRPHEFAESLRRCVLANVGVSLSGDIDLEAKSAEGVIVDKVLGTGAEIGASIGVNGKYLADLLDIFSSPVAQAEFRGDSGPIIVRQGDELMALVMPMRL